jgi:hypothetical protein
VTNNLPAAQYLADYENRRIFTLPGMVRGVTSIFTLPGMVRGVTSAASTSGPAGGWAG